MSKREEAEADPRMEWAKLDLVRYLRNVEAKLKKQRREHDKRGNKIALRADLSERDADRAGRALREARAEVERLRALIQSHRAACCYRCANSDFGGAT